MEQTQLERKVIIKKGITTKKIIKGTTILFGLVLIIFSTLANAILDLENFNFVNWLTNSSILVGIMIFGQLMGESIGQDKQQEKVGGLYQTNLLEYNDFRKLIESIDIYFSQFYIWFKEKELEKKKINFLIDNQFDGQWATAIVKNTSKTDLDNMIYKSGEKTFKVNGKAIKKAHTEEEIAILKEMYSLTLDAPKYSYFLTAFSNLSSSGVLEQGKSLNKKLKNDKRFNRILKITSSLFISLIWGVITIQEIAEGGQLQVWMQLISRITAFTTSFVSGWGSSIISVKTQAEILKNKVNVLKNFKSSMDEGLFKPETYEEEVKRLEKEDEKRQVEMELVDTPPMLEDKTIYQ